MKHRNNNSHINDKLRIVLWPRYASKIKYIKHSIGIHEQKLLS